MLAAATGTPPRQEGQGAGSATGCVCDTSRNLEKKAQGVLLGGDGCVGRLAGKRLHGDIAGWLPTGW